MYYTIYLINSSKFVSFDTIYQNRTAKHRHIELLRAEWKNKEGPFI